jgi:hypothetical protein
VAESYLRRYTDLPSLVYLLRTRKLTLLDPQSWDDTNDSLYLNLYREKKGLGSVLALCFTQAAERYQHWRVFASGSGGVCICFQRTKLLEAVRQMAGLRLGNVRYLNLDQGCNGRHSVEDLPFLKRYPFQDEKEYRMIWESHEESKAAHDIAIELSCIDRVTLSPWLHKALSKHVREMLRSIESCASLKVTRSTLISNEEWKKIGERVAEEMNTSGAPAKATKNRRKRRRRQGLTVS